MKKLVFLALTIILPFSIFAQSKITWSPEETITKNSFQAATPNLSDDNIQQYTFSATFDFGFQMANIQFAFTKNFNKYVEAYYVPNLSWIEEGESTDELLLMANLDFDLVELYARKFRKKLYETKNVGSNANFFTQIHNEINLEFNNHQAVIQSNIRNKEDIEAYLKTQIAEVNKEIIALSEFCMTCKTQKKKKKRRKKGK